MAAPLTLRLDADLRKRVARIAKRKRCTTSAALREAIWTWVQREENSGSFYDSIKDLIGVAEGGDPKLSENTGRRVRELLLARRGERDSG
jgi:predicted DNA-binding protein